MPGSVININMLLVSDRKVSMKLQKCVHACALQGYAKSCAPIVTAVIGQYKFVEAEFDLQLPHREPS